MCGLVRVEMWAGGYAAIGVIAKLVDVKSPESVWSVAGDVPRDDRLGVLIGLFEGDSSLYVGITAKDSNCFSWAFRGQ